MSKVRLLKSNSVRVFHADSSESSQTMNLPGWVFAARHLNGELKSVGEQVVEVLHPTLNFVPAKNLMSRLNDQIKRPGID